MSLLPKGRGGVPEMVKVNSLHRIFAIVNYSTRVSYCMIRFLSLKYECLVTLLMWNSFLKFVGFSSLKLLSV